MTTAVLTTCSANHLALAKNLCNSVLKHNPSFHCYIGLVDRIDGRLDITDFAPHIIIEAHHLGLESFSDMAARYSVFELSCAMKSFFTNHVLDKHQPEKLIYLDADILVFDSLELIEKALAENSFLVNPHFIKSFNEDGLFPTDRNLLATGLYNAGFFAVKNTTHGNAIINWLTEKMVHQCYDRLSEGLFVDQKWYNLIPLFFKDVNIFNHAGCNVAYWSFHEREIRKEGDQFTVNGEPLIFFHFSGYSMDLPEKISRHQTRYTTVSDAVKELMQMYHNALEQGGHRQMLQLENVYVKKKSKSLGKKIRSLFKS